MQTIIRFFKTIFLIDLLKGLWVTLKYTPQPAFTFQYPAERRPTSPRFRGVLRSSSAREHCGNGQPKVACRSAAGLNRRRS